MANQPPPKPPSDSKEPTPADNSKTGLVAAPTEPLEIIPPQIEEALKGQGIDLDDPKIKGELTIAFASAMYQGPIPPPDMLGKYDSVRPGTSVSD